MTIELTKPKSKTRYVVYENSYGYWRTQSDRSRITGDLKNADLFLTKLGAYLSYFDLFCNSKMKIVKVKVTEE